MDATCRTHARDVNRKCWGRGEVWHPTMPSAREHGPVARRRGAPAMTASPSSRWAWQRVEGGIDVNQPRARALAQAAFRRRTARKIVLAGAPSKTGIENTFSPSLSATDAEPINGGGSAILERFPENDVAAVGDDRLRRRCVSPRGPWVRPIAPEGPTHLPRGSDPSPPRVRPFRAVGETLIPPGSDRWGVWVRPRCAGGRTLPTQPPTRWWARVKPMDLMGSTLRPQRFDPHHPGGRPRGPRGS